MSKFGTKKVFFFFLYFWAVILKTDAFFKISTLEFVKSEFTVNFGIGSALSKGPGPGPVSAL